MYFALFLVFVVASRADLCGRLCVFDNQNCIGGSWTKAGGDCQSYVHGGPRGDFCYHIGATASICPASGPPVLPSEVEGLIARRLGSDAGSSSTPSPESADFILPSSYNDHWGYDDDHWGYDYDHWGYDETPTVAGVTGLNLPTDDRQYDENVRVLSRDAYNSDPANAAQDAQYRGLADYLRNLQRSFH